ncbi:MAG TPA: FG-GAP-like repeat-containing protein [Phycisphaerae bacterium]|nr:FG-GAP-like repeat-containing protein [Phycisphaerae bacterium]
MTRWLRLTLVLCPLAAAVLIGCETMFRAPSGGGADRDAGTGVTTDDSTSESSTAGGGDFVDVGGDVVDQRPEPVVVEEEGEETASNFRAIQIDPAREDSAGPKYIRSFDMDNDGLPDLVTGWNESQPIQLHLQRRDMDGRISFVSVNLGGTSPLAVIGGVDVADFDQDGWLDLAVAAKTTGSVGICPKPGALPPYEPKGLQAEIQILFNPGNIDDITDGDAWQLLRLSRSWLPGREDVEVQEARTFPEFNGYTGIAAGEIDGINGPDIVVAFNPVECVFYGDEPPINRVELYPNPGGAATFDQGAVPRAAVANAGPDQPIPVPDPAEENPEPVDVVLDGSGSYSRLADGFYGGVTYMWEQIAGPDVELSGANLAAPTFAAPLTSNILTFRLTVSSGDAADNDLVNVVVGEPANLPPTIESTSGDQSVVPDVDDPDATVVVMSVFATDPDTANLNYTWDQTAGNPVTLNTTATGTASFTASQASGELRFRVTVSDGTGSDSALIVITSGVWAPIRIEGDLPRVSDVEIADVDLDGDADIFYTYPNRISSNISWARNPLVPHSVGGAGGPDVVHGGEATWQHRPVGNVNTFADVIELGDVDLDGFDDVLVRSREGGIVQWFRHPGAADLEPIFPPPDVVPDRFNFPWQVYTMAEYEFHEPAGITIGDLTNDGFNEVIIAAGGVVYWYDAGLVDSPYQSWGENFVVDDTKAQGTTDDPSDPDFIDAGTIVYNVTVVDIDGDGWGDVIATFDRRTLSGLNDDTLLWFRNTLGEQADEGAE